MHRRPDFETLLKASKRGQQWQNFSHLVLNHIENYTVPQYGDYPNDPVTTFTQDEIISSLKRYINRASSNARGPEEAQRDLLKIAHYTCILYSKQEENK